MAEASPSDLPAKTTQKQIVNSIGMRLVLIPAGRFVMGTPKEEKDRRPHEGPQHTLQITKPFYMGAYEVTQEEFEKILGKEKNSSYFKKVEGQDTRRFPVENVTYDEAVLFCQKLSEQDAEKIAGLEYRLPTEAEWEYACRAGTMTVFYLGAKLSSTQANFNGWHPYGKAERGPYLERPTTVGSYRPNPFGLYDMHGNVYEWIADFYEKDYYGKSPLQDPKGGPSGPYRCLRGGSWRNVGSLLRAGDRYYDRPDRRHEDHGFRVVATASSQP